MKKENKNICALCKTGWNCMCSTKIASDGKRVHSTCKDKYEEKINIKKDDKEV